MLTIKELIDANVTRCEEDFEHPLDSWSLLEWTGAITGETGEAANVAKKIKRRSQGMERFNKEDETDENLLEALGNELADAVHYIVLCAAAAGIDLERVLRSKFNEVSDRVGSDKKL